MPVISQSCLTLCDPMDCSPPDSSVHGVLHSALPSVHAWVRLEFKTQLNDERKCTPDIYFAPEIWPMWHASGITVSGRCSPIPEWQLRREISPTSRWGSSFLIPQTSDFSRENPFLRRPVSMMQWCVLGVLLKAQLSLSNHLILCFCLQSFSASESFSVGQLSTSGGQSIGASASETVLPANIQSWFSLTGFISLQSKGLSRVFSSTTVQKHQFFSAQPSLWSSSHFCIWLLDLFTNCSLVVKWLAELNEAMIHDCRVTQNEWVIEKSSDKTWSPGEGNSNPVFLLGELHGQYEEEFLGILIKQDYILVWIATPFSRGSSWPRDQTWVSCITGRFFTIWATREAHHTGQEGLYRLQREEKFE